MHGTWKPNGPWATGWQGGSLGRAEPEVVLGWGKPPPLVPVGSTVSSGVRPVLRTRHVPVVKVRFYVTTGLRLRLDSSLAA
jgi:hypothetical protein